MRKARSVFAFAVASGALATLFAAIVACTTDSEPGVDPTTPDVQNGDVTARDTSAPSNDAGTPNDALSDVKTDASDSAPPTPSACSTFPIMVCDFNGSCPPYGALILSGTGQPNFKPDAGPDGSTALWAYVPDGGLALFGIPFQSPNPNGPTAPIVGCHVTCEANLRVAGGASANMSIVLGNEGDTFELRAEDGGYVQTVPSSAIRVEHDASITSDWVHLTIRLSPPDDAGTPAKSEVTIEAGAASTTTTTTIPMVGQQMRFGALPTSQSEPIDVYVDDIVCRVFE